MARPFVEELPTQDAWAVVRDLLDGKIEDLDLALRTLNDVMSYASWVLKDQFGKPVACCTATEARHILDLVAEGNLTDTQAIDWKAILSLLLKFLTDWLNK